MKKIAYTKPETEIQELEIESLILAGSGDGIDTSNPDKGDGGTSNSEDYNYSNGLWDED